MIAKCRKLVGLFKKKFFDILSIITLNQVRKNVEEFLPASQSCFRVNRSTADAVWAHKWLAAITQRLHMEIEILGIDLTSAFDTINRNKLLNHTKDIFGLDAWRITRLLLTNTKLTVKLSKISSVPFNTNRLTTVRFPQSNTLHGLL